MTMPTTSTAPSTGLWGLITRVGGCPEGATGTELVSGPV